MFLGIIDYLDKMLIFFVLLYRTSISIDLAFSNNTILSCFFLFFLITNLYFLIPAVIVWSFKPTAELVIPTGTATYEANPEKETQPLTSETKIRKCSKIFTVLYFFIFSVIKSWFNLLFLLKGNFFFHLVFTV